MQATFITLNNEEGSNSMKYLVTGSEGPGFASPMETAEVLENIILPTFDTLVKLEGDKKILAGGLPVGDRAFVFIVEAASNEEVDRLLRTIPAWGVLKWQVTALQTFAGRAAQEREVVKELKKGAQMKSQPQRSS
ncbi:MAG: hypothetical protein DMG10_26750 [Acidobacteria bacterium]|nr:MAG: hypothetical protein DMG10_26750 [Acidobacteriota bacterium]